MCFYYVNIEICYTWAQLPKKAKTSLEDKTLPHKYWFKISSTSPCSSWANNRSVIVTQVHRVPPPAVLLRFLQKSLGRPPCGLHIFPKHSMVTVSFLFFHAFCGGMLNYCLHFRSSLVTDVQKRPCLLSPLTHGRAEFANVCTSVQNLQQTISCS